MQAVHSLLNGAVSVELAGAEQSGRVVGYLDGTEYFGGFIATPIAAAVVGDLNRWTFAPIVSASIALTLVGCAYLYARYRNVKSPVHAVA
jgi:hypothetical protein